MDTKNRFYGIESNDISKGVIQVTIPFNRINHVGNKVGNKSLNVSQKKVLAEIRNNPNITKKELCIKCDLGLLLFFVLCRTKKQILK